MTDILFDTSLIDDDLPADHRAGFVAVIGRPNVGKSTLMNHFLGQKIAIVSPKPQTTRNQLLGILTLPSDLQPELADGPPAQLIFIDTPGIHRPHHKLGQFLVDTAVDAIPEADLILWLVDASYPPTKADQMVAQRLQQARAYQPRPVILGLNKVDLLTVESEAVKRLNRPDLAELPEPAQTEAILEAISETYLQLYAADSWLPISALQGDRLTELLQQTIDRLPLGPRYFPADQVTDQHLRFIAAELIREAALHTLQQEVPHAVAVVVREFKERSDSLTYISADIIVERESHKKIVIGKKGRTLKQIGQFARREIEALLDNKLYLDLWVKVRPKWRSKENELKWLGYTL